MSQTAAVPGNIGFKAILEKLPFRQDLGLVVLLVATLSMMVLPMPTWVADTLIGVNICISMVLLFVAVYLKSPAEFTTLPSVILITTIFRLSISITTCRLVLTEGDAGEIIRTFGEFVISGNVVVGLVVFLIISVVQFMVITKGSERVAEVAARFALDAMPGKQMSIDTDVRNGDMKPEDARRKRAMLAQESQMHGAMDGALKFVKGDAIASLIIIAVNLIGGLTIGCVQRGMSFSQAGETYALLAVGDGLIAQIPALLISLTAGLIVTRVDSDNHTNMGIEMINQITADPRVMMVASVVMFVMGTIPGFPMPVFFTLSAILGTTGFIMMRRQNVEKVQSAIAIKDKEAESRGAPIMVQIGPSLAPMKTEIAIALRDVRAAIIEDLGISLPRLEVLDVGDPSTGLRVEMDRLQLLAAPVGADLLWSDNVPPEVFEKAEKHAGPNGREWALVPAGTAEQLEGSGAVVHDAPAMCALFIREMLLRLAGQFVGIQETQSIISKMEKSYGDLVREAMKSAPLPRLAEVFRRLVEEQVSLRNMRQVMEAVAEWAPREKATAALTEYVRVGLRQQICMSCATADLRLPVVLIEDDLASTLSQSLHDTITGAQLRPEDPDYLVDQIRSFMVGGARPALVTTMELRRPLWDLLSRHGVMATVLSHPEVAPSFRVEVAGTVGPQEAEAAAPRPALRAVQGGGAAAAPPTGLRRA